MVMLTEEMVIARTKSSNLETVTKFNCWGSQLSDVSILKKMKNVTVLSLSVNNIDSLEVFQFCTKLQDLFIRKNNIQDLNQVCYLQGLQELKCLWLEDNPCCLNIGEQYRLAVIRALPQLKKLDNTPVETSEMEMAQRVGKPLTHPDVLQEYYSNSDDEDDYIYSGQQMIKEEKRSPSPETDFRTRNNYSPEPVQYQRGSRDYSSSYEVNEQNSYNNSEGGDARDIYSEQINQNQQNHRQPMTITYKYEEEPSSRQQNHRAQGMLPRSRTTDGELGHNNCPNCCTLPPQRRPNERRTNVLNAVLCLIKELDYPNLEVVQMAVKCRMEELCNEIKEKYDSSE
nr:uncharacterized protein F09G8.5 isoform X2 [Halyomorpha halys]